MSRLLIRGGNRLQGEVTIQGAKNSVLPILAEGVRNTFTPPTPARALTR